MNLIQRLLFSCQVTTFYYFSQVYTGRWLVDGNPQIIMFDIGSASHELNKYKHELFESTKIGIPHGDIECNDSVIFGFMVAKFLEEVELQRRFTFPCILLIAFQILNTKFIISSFFSF